MQGFSRLPNPDLKNIEVVVNGKSIGVSTKREIVQQEDGHAVLMLTIPETAPED